MHVMIARFAAFLLVLIVGLPSTAMARTGPVELRTPDGKRVWVYLPNTWDRGTKFPCVVVPPAGSRLFHGMSLGAGDRSEHLPYVVAGFAVVSFDISGPWSDEATPAAQAEAIRTFMKADLGVKDALEALQIATTKYPEIDRTRVYIAGHSSAATLALQVAAASDQFRGCIAYAPTTNLEEEFKPETLKTLEPFAPGISAALVKGSPSNQVAAYRCPIFLFHAEDDRSVPVASILAFKNALLRNGKSVEQVTVPSGGHYDSMIKQGIPKGLAWLKALDAQAPKR
jgi:dipeptidyl aminopeptidase/acylaminoacyl peptidase